MLRRLAAGVRPSHRRPSDALTSVNLGSIARQRGGQTAATVPERLPGTVLREDGKLGEGTSDAFKRVTGHFLAGDPRAKKTQA